MGNNPSSFVGDIISPSVASKIGKLLDGLCELNRFELAEQLITPILEKPSRLEDICRYLEGNFITRQLADKIVEFYNPIILEEPQSPKEYVALMKSPSLVKKIKMSPKIAETILIELAKNKKSLLENLDLFNNRDGVNSTQEAITNIATDMFAGRSYKTCSQDIVLEILRNIPSDILVEAENLGNVTRFDTYDKLDVVYSLAPISDSLVEKLFLKNVSTSVINSYLNLGMKPSLKVLENYRNNHLSSIVLLSHYPDNLSEEQALEIYDSDELFNITQAKKTENNCTICMTDKLSVWFKCKKGDNSPLVCGACNAKNFSKCPICRDHLTSVIL